MSWETKNYYRCLFNQRFIEYGISPLLQDKIVGFIAIGASIPSATGSFISLLPRSKRIVLALFGTKAPASALQNGLCSDLNEKDLIRVQQQFAPESKKLFTDSIKKRGGKCGMPYTSD